MDLEIYSCGSGSVPARASCGGEEEQQLKESVRTFSGCSPVVNPAVVIRGGVSGHRRVCRGGYWCADTKITGDI